MSKSAKLRGFIGPPQRYHLSGWAFDPEQPNMHLEVEIWLDGTFLGKTNANLYFDHLNKAGIGNGDHGFIYNAERELPITEKKRIQVFAVSSLGRKVLAFATPRAAPTVKPEEPRFPHESADDKHHPVFIFGSARSGTSALAQALARNTRYTGQGEGHLLDLAARLEETIAGHYERRRGEWVGSAKTMIAAAPQAFFVDAARYGFVVLTRALFPGGYWLDKTPRADMTLAAPALLRIWPNARFVFMRRRAFENIESRRRKFPEIDFAAHCVGWVESFAAWDRVRPLLAGRALEIDHYVLSRTPDLVSKVLASFLNLDVAERTRLNQALSLDRPERTSARFAELYDSTELPWSPAQWESFKCICTETSNRLGYAQGREYFLPGRDNEGLILV